MKILIFTFCFPPKVGGAQTLMYSLAKGFALNGHTVCVFTPDRPNSSEFDNQQPFRVKRVSQHVAPGRGAIFAKLFQKLQLVVSLYAQLISFRPDVILCNPWDPCGYLTLGSFILGIPYIVLVLGTELMLLPERGLPRRFKQWLRKITHLRATGVIAISRYTKSRLVAIGIPAQKIAVIPCGIDVDQIIPAASIRDQTMPQSPTLMTVCRLEEEKGCSTLLRALPPLIARYPSLHCRIVGGGPSQKNYEALAAELGVIDHVTFHGKVSEADKNHLYETSDLFVMVPPAASETGFEGFGIVYLEAMAHGLAVIGGNTGGVPDAVEDNVTGKLVPADDPLALAQAVDALLAQPAQRQEMIHAARTRLYERFTWNLVCDAYLHEISQRLGRRQGVDQPLTGSESP